MDAILDLSYDDPDGFLSFLQELVDRKRLDPPASGIALQALDKGLESLSPRQQHALMVGVDTFITKRCAHGGHRIPWSEMLAAYDYAHGKCAFCYQITTKDD
jgi:hypothetical protein